MLTIVRGNFQQIPNFKARVQKVLKNELPNEGRNKEDRKRLMDKAFAILQDVLRLPEECKNSIYEEFDPVLLTTECVEKWMYKAFDDILDYDGDDAGFIKMLKERNADLIVKIISEVEEGFIEGINDVMVFIRISCSNVLMAAAPPAQAATAKGIAIPCIMKFAEKSWNERPNKAEAPVAQATAPATQVQKET